MNIIRDTQSLAKTAGQALEKMMLSSDGKPLLLLLSGGSAFKILEHVSEKVFIGQNITVGMLDDRYTQDASESNFVLLRASGFFFKGLQHAAVFLDSSVSEFEILEIYTERYRLEIEKWHALYPDGIIKAVVGIGPDGHTAGIMPFPENPTLFAELFESDAKIVGYDAQDKNPHRYRMTSTLSFMRNFEETLVYIAGQEKTEAFNRLQAEEGSLAETPARILREMKNVTVYTDITDVI